MNEGFNQKCHWGLMKHSDEKEVDGISTVNNKIVVCTNSSCPQKYCKFFFFTAGLVPDEECEYYTPSVRKREQ